MNEPEVCVKRMNRNRKPAFSKRERPEIQFEITVTADDSAGNFRFSLE